MTNRFLAVQQLNHLDELVWYKNRTDGSLWKCLWRNLRGGKETNRAVTFVAIDMDKKEMTEKTVKVVYTIHLENRKYK